MHPTDLRGEIIGTMLEKELRWPNAFDVSIDAVYRGHADLLADLFAVVLARTAFALRERERLGLLEAKPFSNG